MSPIFNLIILIIIFNLINFIKSNDDDGFCYRKEDCENDLHIFTNNELNGMKYLIYDVNRDKSYSSKRQTYINMARLVQNLGTNWTLVLPPWGLYVKPSIDDNFKNKIDWSEFFKIGILQELISVVEFHTFLEHVASELDLILILNRFNDNELIIKEKTFLNKYELIDNDCKHIQFYEKEEHIYGLFFGYKDYLKAKKMRCLNIDGDFKLIENLLNNELKNQHTIYMQNVDLIRSFDQDDRNYWLFRRSIQLADSIVQRANQFRRKYFDSDDEKDKTFLISDLQLDKKIDQLNKQKQSNIALGGNYLSIHLLINKDNLIDDTIEQFNNYNKINDEKIKLNEIVNQILIALKQTNLTLVFVSTDGDDKLFNKLKTEFNNQLANESRSLDKYKLIRYRNKSNKLSPVELELIEQWICSHSRLFIGSSNSMFTKFIQEEREILGFESSTTFNYFCTENDKFNYESNQLCKIKPNKIKY